MPKTEAEKRATSKFEKKAYDKFLLRLRKDSDINSTVLKKYTESRNESVNGFILRAIRETMERDADKQRNESNG